MAAEEDGLDHGRWPRAGKQMHHSRCATHFRVGLCGLLPFYTQFDRTAHVMIKKEFFFWPVGVFLRKVGCIPVDRGSAAAMVKGLIEEMEKVDQFHLAIAPEGTRKAVKKWKTGYHLIAREVGCPVYMGFFDWKTKRVGIGEKVELTDDARADTDRIQTIYETMHFEGKHPEGYITH